MLSLKITWSPKIFHRNLCAFWAIYCVDMLFQSRDIRENVLGLGEPITAENFWHFWVRIFEEVWYVGETPDKSHSCARPRQFVYNIMCGNRERDVQLCMGCVRVQKNLKSWKQSHQSFNFAYLPRDATARTMWITVGVSRDLRKIVKCANVFSIGSGDFVLWGPKSASPILNPYCP